MHKTVVATLTAALMAAPLLAVSQDESADEPYTLKGHTGVVDTLCRYSEYMSCVHTVERQIVWFCASLQGYEFLGDQVPAECVTCENVRKYADLQLGLASVDQRLEFPIFYKMLRKIALETIPCKTLGDAAEALEAEIEAEKSLSEAAK